MIYQWKKSLPYFAKAGNQMSYKFLMAADFWIFLNLILALLFSIPAVNFFTHGTHVTVAHSMGTTIGINTTILLASLLYIARRLNPSMDTRLAEKGVKIFNVSLFFFWVSLLIAGVKKSIWMYFSNNIPFGNMQDSLHWVYVSFVVFGIGIFIGIGLIAIPLLKTFYSAYFIKDVPEQQAAPAVQVRLLVPVEIEG
jgi:nitric oxide reductase subunit B